MLAADRVVICFVVTLALFLSEIGWALAADAPAQKAVVFGTPTANLRAGASVEQGIKLTLKEGDAVTVEKLEGEWYLVAAADGQKGYIHKNLLKPVANAGAPAAVPAAPEKAITATPATPPSVVVAPAAPTLPVEKASVAAPVTPPSTVTPPAPPKNEKAPTPTASPPVRVKAAEGQAPSLLQILEAHEAEVKIGLLVAAMAFVLGWVCGSLFAVRRERRSRRRLRL